MIKQRIAIGTVQFGVPYGINNARPVDEEEIEKILQSALLNGIDTLDTAITYGVSEQRLGNIGVDKWKVISKIPNIPDSCNDSSKWIFKAIDASLGRLRVNNLYGLLFHSTTQLLGPQGDIMYKAFLSLKERGIVSKIGISFSSFDDLDILCSRYSFDLIQVPYNILDRRMLNTGWLAKLHNIGVEIHLRSVFLKGLLLKELTEQNLKFNKWHSLWESWHNWLLKQQITALEACLNFALYQKEVNRVVIGIRSLLHLQEILAVKELFFKPPDDLVSADLNLICPSLWQI